MILLALLLAAVPPPPPNAPSSVGVRVFESGHDAGIARSLNFVGSTVACDAGSAYCTVTGGGGGAPTTASYLTEVPEAGLSAEFPMSSLATGLVKNTTATGVPTIYAGTSCTNQFPRSLDTSGAATCASVSLPNDTTGILTVAKGGTGSAPASDDQVLVSDSTVAATWRSVPNCTDTAGQHLNYTASTNGWSCGTSATATAPGGSSPQVQYNNSSAFGGIANVQSDGNRLVIVGETSHPATPGSNALSYNFLIAAGAPPQDTERDPSLGVPVPKALLGLLSSAGNYGLHWQCIKPEQYNSTSTFGLLNTFTGASVGQSGAATVAWASTSLLTRLMWQMYQSAAGAGSSASILMNYKHSWRGNAAGAGGFIATTRVAIHTPQTNSRTFFGLRDTVGAITSVEPNTLTNTIYIGSNAGEANLSICSNDNVGTATCNTLGANFPATTADAIYDIAFWASPNEAAIHYSIDRLDSVQHADNSVSSDLPQNTVQLGWQDWINNGTTAASAKFYWGGFCSLDNV